jgi:tRNA A-37 threonylcarbamoyl transferase component Bud32
VSSVLVARFEVRSAVAPIVRAALEIDIVYVPLAQAPPSGRQVLQLFVGDELVAAVVAELVGSGRDGAYPLRVRLLDPAHRPELERLSGGPSLPPPGPVARSREPKVAGADHEDKTLASRAADMEDSTLASGRLAPAVSIPTPLPPEAEVVATTVFDPDGVLRAKDLHTGSEDLTLQRSTGGAARTSVRRDAFFTDDESQTLPGSTPVVPGATTDVSWNVRIAPTTKDPLCGRTIGGGKYVLDSVIGTGAIGIVFKASHRDLGRTVAIKVLNPRYRDDPDLLAVFRTEARAASQLEHPNVARVYDYGQESDGLVYIVMEYLSGYTLGSVLAARRTLTVSRAIDVMMQVCAGLSAAHDRDIVHRDVKPDNVVLVPAQDDEGHPVEIVKVCDFGIAALGTAQTGEGAAAGTPEYMAPEQTTGSAVQPSADVYACGVVLYEMLTGQVPFTADQAYRILMKHRSEAPRRPSSIDASISPKLEAVVLRCMEKAPDRRYQSARELRVELRKLADVKA